MGQTETNAEELALRVSVASHPVGKLPRLSPDQFQALCRDMQGAFPDVVRSSYAGIVETGTATSASERAQFDINGPEPSPVDFDWRFDGRTALALAKILLRQNCEVLCMGAPTVYGAVRSLGGKAFLIDRNPLLEKNLAPDTHLIADISTEEELPRRVDKQFAAAILDPPWYGEAYDLWFARTLPLLRAGAELLVVMFRKFTRPSAKRQRDQLIRQFESVGQLVAEEFEVVYSTPPFEDEVLLRLELPRMPSWRAADVLKIQLHSKPDLAVFRPGLWPVNKWERFALGGQVIAVKDVPNDNGPLRIVGDLPRELKSVSQRDPARELYNVWTSRSRAGVVTGTKRLASILSKPEAAIDRSDIQVATQLSRELGFQIGR
jgi:Probable N6-adenine methyltransferase